ncbi:MAG: hypothetical protein K2J47_02325 [Ruminococcus sp.]|nr:hypothetical protein [Ruminococcus sp.]MDE6788144.1 hypothetical protein [Ruminococcus sp.]
MYSKLIKQIKEKIDFGSGILQATDDEKMLVDVKWKHNVHFIIKVFYGTLWYYVTRNGEQVAMTYTARKIDDIFFKSIQHLVNDIKDGKFNFKKTHSEKVADIIREKRLVGYMNNTKWKEFVHAMDEEMSVDVPYDLKTIFEECHDEFFDRFYDCESFNYYDFKSIEWVKVKPKFFESIHKGMLIPDEEIPHDYTKEFIDLMKKYSISYKYDEINEVYIIYGYK